MFLFSKASILAVISRDPPPPKSLFCYWNPFCGQRWNGVKCLWSGTKGRQKLVLVVTPGLSSKISHWNTFAKYLPGNCDVVPTTRVLVHSTYRMTKWPHTNNSFVCLSDQVVGTEPQVSNCWISKH
jgi:hypothetical protein